MGNKRRPEFTIIIPAYNIEKHISECINSIKNQSFADFECIVIDDGSTDATYTATQKSISGDKRFELINMSNGGPQKAKAEGLDRAQGEYVLFIDADDTLHTDCLMRCNESVNDCDLLIFGINYQEFSGGVLVSERKVELMETVFKSGAELADWYIVNHKLLLYPNFNKCYRTGVLKKQNIKFRADVYFGEDRLFNFDFLKVSGKIKIIPDALYNHRKIKQSSITSVFRPHHIDELYFLHKAKMDCILNLSKTKNKEGKEAFKKYDVRKTVCQAFGHIAEHINELTVEALDEELKYLSLYRLPDYFYSSNEYPGDNLIDYINSLVFPENSEIDCDEITTVVVLGSTRCKYRIEGAFQKIGKRKYICCGGNISAYSDTDGHFLTEAEYMNRYLNKVGITDVLIENYSENTAENIKNAASMINQNENPVVVTGAFHQARTEQILKQMGLNWKVFPIYGPNTKPDNWYKSKIGITAIIGEFEGMI